MPDLSAFLKEEKYIDFSSPVVSRKANDLFRDCKSDAEKAKTAFLFVRDGIPHTFDIRSDIVTAKASDVLLNGTGICHAKANLLAALLRSQGIPTGFCFMHLTLADDLSLGHCVHCLNAVYIENRWVRLDARGNTNGIHAQFSLGQPMLAFSPRPDYGEFFWPGIYARPHAATMQMLEHAECLADIVERIPDSVTEPPDLDA